jgi:hypothetical protein
MKKFILARSVLFRVLENFRMFFWLYLMRFAN